MAENSIDNKTADKLISHLQEMRKASHLQVHRKEISAWAATVLYLGILAVLSKVIFLDNIGTFLESILILTLVDILVFGFFALFSYFVFLQYSGIHEQSDFIRTYDKRIYDLLRGNRVFVFTIEGDESFPISILKDKERQDCKHTDEGSGWLRWVLPIKTVVWKIQKKNKTNYTNAAVQEGVIYDIFILSTFVFVGYPFLTKFLVFVLCNLKAWFIDFWGDFLNWIP